MIQRVSAPLSLRALSENRLTLIEQDWGRTVYPIGPVYWLRHRWLNTVILAALMLFSVALCACDRVHPGHKVQLAAYYDVRDYGAGRKTSSGSRNSCG